MVYCWSAHMLGKSASKAHRHSLHCIMVHVACYPIRLGSRLVQMCGAANVARDNSGVAL